MSANSAQFALCQAVAALLADLPALLGVAGRGGQLSAEQRALVEQWVRDPQGWGGSQAH